MIDRIDLEESLFIISSGVGPDQHDKDVLDGAIGDIASLFINLTKRIEELENPVMKAVDL